MRISASARSWAVFAVGITLLLVAWAYWMSRVGPSWWYPYRNGGPSTLSTGQKAERVRETIFYTGVAVCMLAPFLSSAPLRRRILRSVLAGVAAIVAMYVMGFIVFFGLYGF
jgi:hypothetical protein